MSRQVWQVSIYKEGIIEIDTDEKKLITNLLTNPPNFEIIDSQLKVEIHAGICK